MSSSIREAHCSDCLFFSHSVENALPENCDKRKTKDGKLRYPLNQCNLDYVSRYYKERLAYGDDLTMCDNGRTIVENKILLKGW